MNIQLNSIPRTTLHKIHLVSIQTPQEIRDEIQKKIDESLARKMAESQENKTGNVTGSIQNPDICLKTAA